MKYVSVTKTSNEASVRVINNETRSAISETNISDFCPIDSAIYLGAQIALTLNIPFLVNGFSQNPNDVPAN